MKHKSIIILFCMAAALMSSCGEKTQKAGETSNIRSKSDESYIGTWKASGSHPLGYSHGKYAIQLDISPDGSCGMSVQYDLNKTAMSDKFSDIIHLKGDWSVDDGLIQVRLKVTSWVVTDLADYRSEESFDDFFTPISLKLENGSLSPDEYSRTINLGSTESARDGKLLTGEGKGIMLRAVEFLRE